jgi:hypothetical protein
VLRLMSLVAPWLFPTIYNIRILGLGVERLGLLFRHELSSLIAPLLSKGDKFPALSGLTTSEGPHSLKMSSPFSTTKSPSWPFVVPGTTKSSFRLSGIE